MRQHRRSMIIFWLKPFFFKHQTIVDMYHFLSECAARIGQISHLVRLYDYNPDKHQKIEFCLPDQGEEVIKYLNMHYHTIASIDLCFEAKFQHGSRKITYTAMFEKHTHSSINAVLRLAFQGVHVSGLFIDFYLEELQRDMAHGYQPKPSDDFVIPSFEAYDLVKEWMNVLQAEECCGGDYTDDFSPYFDGGNYYKYSDFRFRRNGPQYVDVSLEDHKHYLRGDVEDQIIQELRARGLPEDICKRYEPWPYGRIIDATWDEYYQMFKKGVKPSMRYADEAELYDHPDALFGDIKARAVKHEQLQEKLKSGEINFDDGFMTID